MRKLFIATIMLSLFCVLAVPARSQTIHSIKRAKHKKKALPPLIPPTSFLVDEIATDDQQTAMVHQYLDKKLKDLQGDLEKYPGLRDQIQSLIDEINALELLPVDDPGYAEKFDAMHATLLFLWEMESYDTI